MEFQHRNWYSFVWICGDQIVEQHLHNIDVCNWFMGTHPVEVVATGGAAWRPREEELRQYLRPHRRRFRVPERRPHVELLPPVPGQEHCAERERADRRHEGRDRLRTGCAARRPVESLRPGAHAT